MTTEARRTGSLSTLHNRAAADLVAMNQTDWDCVDVLDWAGPITAGELARRVGLTSGAITGVVDRLERIGIVRRSADRADRRRVIIELVVSAERIDAPGFAELHRRFGALAADIDGVNEEFTDHELEVVARWLQVANQMLERSIERMRGG